MSALREVLQMQQPGMALQRRATVGPARLRLTVSCRTLRRRQSLAIVKRQMGFVKTFVRISDHTRKPPYVKAENGRLYAESAVLYDILHTCRPNLPCYSGRLSGK